MNKTAVAMYMAALGVLIASAAPAAHHSAVAFDTQHPVVLSGTVIEWYWANPHCLLRFDVTDRSGRVVHWVAETSNPRDMTNQGWTRTSLKRGDKVTASVLPAKTGQPVGRITQVLRADGTKVGSAGGAAAASGR